MPHITEKYWSFYTGLPAQQEPSLQKFSLGLRLSRSSVLLCVDSLRQDACLHFRLTPALPATPVETMPLFDNSHKIFGVEFLIGSDDLSLGWKSVYIKSCKVERKSKVGIPKNNQDAESRRWEKRC